MIKEDRFREILNYLLIIGIFILAFLVIRPILFAITYGMLFAYIVYPIYKFVLRKTKNSNLASLIVCLSIFILLTIIFGVILGSMFNQLFNIYFAAQKINLTKILETALPLSQDISTNLANSIEVSFSNLLTSYASKIGDVIFNLPNLLLQLLVVFLILFYALRDGDKAFRYFKSLSPMKKDTQAKFFQHFKDITNSVLVGQIVVGVIQGIVAGIGYFIFGVPNALLMTVLTMVIGVVPIIGPWLIWIPIDIYLFAVDRTGAGLGLFLYGLFLINWVDTIIRPMIVSRRTQINPAIILIGMIGGLYVFGLLGLIIGPLILAYVMLIFELYRKQSFGEDIIFKKIKDYNPFK
jgi:predicted PurR-regulated permease PerM